MALQVPPDAEGVVVLRVDPSGPAAVHVETGDVVTAVDGVPVAGDGTVTLRHEERVDLSHIIRSHQIGDDLSMSLLRSGQVRRRGGSRTAACTACGRVC